MKPFALLLAIAPLYAGQIVLGTNAIVNGDAEAGAGSSDGSVVASIPGWSTLNGNFTVVQYGATGGFPGFGDPGPAARGSNFFAGGPGTGLGSGDQMLDVSNVASQIDASQIDFVISGFFGGWGSQDDHSQIVLYFRDGSNTILNPSGFALTGPLAVDRINQTGLFFEQKNGTIPVGTRTVEFVLNMYYSTGSYNDGYADNLSFIATASTASPAPSVPEPGTIGLIGAGIAAIMMVCESRSRRCRAK